MTARDKLYIGGAWVAPASSGTLPVENPATGEIIGTVPEGTAADVDAAVAAARAAFDGWAALLMTERGAVLDRLHAALTARSDDIARTVGLELGAPLKIAKGVHAGLPLTVLRGYADLALKPGDLETIRNSLVVHEPVGVVGAITPWNYPLHQVVAKVAAALAAGCTVVLKPSELTPLVAYLLMDAADEAGVPPGVLNLVSGTGPVVGEAIAAHPDVDMVSFTGSVRAGRRVQEVAAGTVKKVALELGGKSANVILDDAELAKAVKVGVANCYLNGGQTCTAWTRMLVPESLHSAAVELAIDSAEKYTVGDPLDGATRLGPMVSAAQRDRVRGYIEKGIAEGATLATGGPSAPLDRGFFVRPTVFAAVRPESTIAQEEIFGPVLSVIPYRSEAEAVEIANGTPYGLSGAVFAGDRHRAVAFARQLRTGQVMVNGGAFNPLAPFGGYKQSGTGRELGRYGLEEFLEVKSLQL